MEPSSTQRHSNIQTIRLSVVPQKLNFAQRNFLGCYRAFLQLIVIMLYLPHMSCRLSFHDKGPPPTYITTSQHIFSWQNFIYDLKTLVVCTVPAPQEKITTLDSLMPIFRYNPSAAVRRDRQAQSSAPATRSAPPSPKTKATGRQKREGPRQQGEQ